jgi:hypothetical protein
MSEMIDYQTMSRMRSLPRIMGTLEEKIEQDREKLQRIRNDLLYEYAQRGRLAWEERTLTAKIERNVEKLHQLRHEEMCARQKMQEVFA